MVKVRDLFIYPLKSARAISRDAIRLSDTGPEWDRHWMIVDEAGAFVTQRTHPQLARIEPEITATTLMLRAPGLQSLELPLAPRGEERVVRVWRDGCRALDQGSAAAEWVSAASGDRVRLVRIAPAAGRLADPRYVGARPTPVSFADGFPMLVCNAASLEELNARMPEPIPMARFRPNIVLEGLPAFAEDHIAEIEIGLVTLRLVKPCTRCVITSTDQQTGERSTNPLPVLRRFRFDASLKGVTFGQNAIVVRGSGAGLIRGTECRVDYVMDRPSG